MLLAASAPLAMPNPASAGHRWALAQTETAPATSPAPMTPLDRLKARSAQQRWTELNQPGKPPDVSPSRLVPEPRDVPALDSVPAVDRSASPNKGDVDTAPQSPPFRSNVTRRIPSDPIAVQERTIAAAQPEITPYVEPVRDPKQLRKLTSIMPFYDYTPAGAPGYPDACHNLCPRPNEDRCKNCQDGKCPECPEEVPLTSEAYATRVIPELHYCWFASDVYYNPLYFEDIEVERYGHIYCPWFVQPVASVGKFGVQLLGMPYQATIHPIWERQTPLGHYRPGEFAPYKHYLIPWNTRAALAEGAFAVGAVYFIP